MLFTAPAAVLKMRTKIYCVSWSCFQVPNIKYFCGRLFLVNIIGQVQQIFHCSITISSWNSNVSLSSRTITHHRFVTVWAVHKNTFDLRDGETHCDSFEQNKPCSLVWQRTSFHRSMPKFGCYQAKTHFQMGITIYISTRVFPCPSLALPFAPTNQPTPVPTTREDPSQITDPILLIARRLFFVSEVDTLFISAGMQQCHYPLFNMTQFPPGKEGANRYAKDLNKCP